MLIEAIDNVSPVEAFQGLRKMPMPFMFSGGVERWQRRFSFVSANPFMTLKADDRGVILEGEKERFFRHKDPFMALSEVLSEEMNRGRVNEGPFPFNSGAAGYFSYDLKDIIETRIKENPSHRNDPAVIPYCILGFYDPVFIYDHNELKGYLISKNGNKKKIKAFKDSISAKKDNLSFEHAPSRASVQVFSSTHTKAQYIDSVITAQEYIASGDIYQINLSQRLQIPMRGSAFSLYSSLIRTSPAPFSSFMDFGSFQIISNSPERLLRVKDGFVETSPIKGTRPRGDTPEKDRRFIEELKGSAKERAEHVMIVDLERNDLGRISLSGTIEVAGFESIETFPGLHHMVSTIRGRLKPGIDAPLALRAVFPGGSVTGAPKMRAMEIIEELEPVPRSLYTGGIGWIDYSGEMDIAMAIRSAICKDGSLYLGVGGGIVADSVPDEEYEETILKAKSFLEVMGIDLNKPSK